MKTGTPNRRRHQRIRAALSFTGVERHSGQPVTLRDFSVKALAIESGERILPNETVEIELSHAGQTLVVTGTPVRSDRVLSASGRGVWLTPIAVQCNTPQERARFEVLVGTIPKSPRQG